MSIAKKITGQAGIYFAGTLFSVAIGFFFKIYISKELGADMLGIYALGMTVVTILSVFLSLGLGNGLVRFVSKYIAQENYTQLHTYLRKTLSITVMMSVISASLFFIIPDIIAGTLLNSPELTPYLPYFGVLLFINAIITLCDQTIRGLQEVRKSTLIGHFIRLPLKIAIAVGFITIGYQLEGYIWAEIIGAIVALGLFFGLIKKLLPKQMPKLTLKPSTLVTKEERTFGNNMLLINTIGLLQGQGDKIVLAIYLTTTDLGIYSIALTLTAFVPTILLSVNAIFTPIISQLHTEKRMQELKKYYQASCKYIFVLTIPLIVFLIVFNQPMLNVFGEEFKLGGQVLILLLIAQVINTSTGSVGMMLNMTGLERVSRNSAIIIAVLSIIGYLLLIPKYGLIGIGITKLVVVLVQSGYAVFMLYSKQHIQPFNMSYVKIIIVFLISAFAYYYLGEGTLDDLAHPLWLFVGLCVTYLIFVSLFLVFSAKEDRQFIKSLMNKSVKA
ncbi:oligosaccharide flippase family protein [Psychroserpens algicola]|uniref:Flippase n=1 Tax=Psychroserpens algicola TaxID=1719034 RepID=A0ABT0H971_9FLAO|nr:oligosaccharide flippase family protein [Psychroserpens algicola]MCK8480549.1 flippase [Psychroserpens algicola]